MKAFLKQLKFYFALAGDKILIFTFLSAISTALTAIAAACFMSVISPDSGASSSNRITRTTDAVFSYFNISSQNDKLIWLLAISSAAFLCSGSFLFISRIFVATIETALFKRLQGDIVAKLFNSNYEYYASKNTGHLTNALTSQIISVATSFSFVGTLTINTFQALLFLAMPFSISVKMSSFAICLGALYIPLMRLVNRKTRHYSIKNSYNFSEQNDIVIQTLSSFKYLKATHTWPKVASMIASTTRKLCKVFIRMAVWSSLSGDAIQPVAVCCMTAIFYYQIKFAHIERIDAIMLLGFLYMAYQKAITIPVAVQKFLACSGSIQIYTELSSELANEQEPMPDTPIKPDFSGSIKLHSVSFSYRTSKSKVLDSVSLEIPTNACVAFVGGSGAGKSTIVNMLAGLLRPTQGEISLAGTPFSKLDIHSYRSSTGYVTQEPVVFNDTVANNISLWDSAKSMQDIKSAAAMASADSFIDSMKDGFSTVLGDRGVLLSGGQRQRITIARELVRDGSILILDEATSALDSETEQAIQKGIDSIKGSKTIVIIAHRLSTIRNCDTIFVLESGRIVESGSYSQLIKAGGKFKEMVERQTLGMDD